MSLLDRLGGRKAAEESLTPKQQPRPSTPPVQPSTPTKQDSTSFASRRPKDVTKIDSTAFTARRSVSNEERSARLCHCSTD